jgi:hypothetical protein
MDACDSKRRQMCFYGEGVGCKMVVGHGSGGGPCHGLCSKSTLESVRILSQKEIELNFFGAKN